MPTLFSLGVPKSLDQDGHAGGGSTVAAAVSNNVCFVERNHGAGEPTSYENIAACDDGLASGGERLADRWCACPSLDDRALSGRAFAPGGRVESLPPPEPAP